MSLLTKVFNDLTNFVLMGEIISKGPTLSNRGLFLLFVLLFHVGFAVQIKADQGQEDDDYVLAYINVTVPDSHGKNIQIWESEPSPIIIGKYGRGRIGPAEGVLVHVRSLKFDQTNASDSDGAPVYVNTGCDLNFDPDNIPKNSEEKWIALIRKGQCSLTKKILNALSNNASGVIIYDEDERSLERAHHRSTYYNTPSLVSVTISKDKGERLARLVDAVSNGTTWVRVTILVGERQTFRLNNINRTSVLFVSISFIVLMVISLAWLIFYYIQRFRYINVKDKLAKRLSNAAKKALAKIPVKTLKEGDVDGECCAVCLEPYKILDIVLVLPCSHQFHKLCITQWILEQRNCPMCKMDILKHYGLMQSGSGNEAAETEASVPNANVGNSDRRSSNSSITPSHQTAVAHIALQEVQCQPVVQVNPSGQQTLEPYTTVDAIKISIQDEK